ncbi:MAG: nuclear transport factor 2 family protein [Chloroflexi bacterium]|nr:nuclear transport factor 2 family protein [Chloroflexota bacterium]
MRAEQEIRSLLTTYEGALNTSDAELAASLYTADGVFMPHQFPSSVGPHVRDAYQQIFEAIGLDIAFSVDEVTVVGDFAYALTRSRGSQTINATGEISPEENRELFTFAKVNSYWKIARYIFNKMS